MNKYKTSAEESEIDSKMKLCICISINSSYVNPIRFGDIQTILRKCKLFTSVFIDLSPRSNPKY